MSPIDDAFPVEDVPSPQFTVHVQLPSITPASLKRARIVNGSVAMIVPLAPASTTGATFCTLVLPLNVLSPPSLSRSFTASVKLFGPSGAGQLAVFVELNALNAAPLQENANCSVLTSALKSLAPAREKVTTSPSLTDA